MKHIFHKRAFTRNCPLANARCDPYGVRTHTAYTLWAIALTLRGDTVPSGGNVIYVDNVKRHSQIWRIECVKEIRYTQHRKVF